MLTSAEEAELRASLRFRPQDRWLQLLYRRAPALHCVGGVRSSVQGDPWCSLHASQKVRPPMCEVLFLD